MRDLGTTIDIHGGGSDLIFPHHECEAAQSESATGEPFVRHWIHTPMVKLDGIKMSKSLGNLVFISDLLKDWEAPAIRLAIIDHSYRQDWSWTDDLMPAAAARIDAWRATGPGDGALEDVRRAIDDDLDTRGALAAIDDAASSGKGVTAAAALLGITL
jgi:L-cysteine:1D-myo-inositol 2-amino-2-deoxy-alpha-D-glucopyranoside ligase